MSSWRPIAQKPTRLLYASNLDGLESGAVRGLGLRERIFWRHSGACPFGICLAPEQPLAPSEIKVPFWPYRPAYGPESSVMPIVTLPGAVQDPMVFLATEPRTPASLQSSLHGGKKRRLASVVIELPNPAAVGSEIQSLSAQGFFELRRA